MTPLVREILSSSVPPATHSSPSQALEGLFELTRRPSRALDSPRLLLPNSSDTRTPPEVCKAKCPGPRTPSRTTDTNLDCAPVENALVWVAPKIGGSWASLGPPVLPLFGLKYDNPPSSLFQFCLSAALRISYYYNHSYSY